MIKHKIKFRHHKKRNTAFLFEILVKELTKTILFKDEDKKKIIVNIIKEFFNKSTQLGKELILYNIISKTKNVPKEIAERILQETKRQFISLDKTEIFHQQSQLINKINEISSDIFLNFVPGYKFLATTAQIFRRFFFNQK